MTSYDGLLKSREASPGAPVGRLLYGVAKGDRPAGAAQRHALCPQVEKHALPLATQHSHQSRGRHSVYRHNSLALHRKIGRRWLQTRRNRFRAAQGRKSLRHFCAARSEQARTLHKDSAKKWEYFRTKFSLQHGVSTPL